MLFQCCADNEDGGPALEQHWVNASFLMGKSYTAVTKIGPLLGHHQGRWPSTTAALSQ